MKEFLINNWRIILEAALVITSAVLFIVRKKPVQVIDTLKETIIRLLPYCIQKAESSPKGQKLSVCLKLLKSVLASMGIELNDDYERFASEQVEVILSTPQKKGVVYEKTHVK